MSMAEAAGRVPRLLRRLHGLPPFLKTFNFVTMHNTFIWRFRKANLVEPVSEIDEGFEAYERITAAYPRVEADLVSGHGDLKPENILFDGERVWLVDWQAAFVNDRYFDLAIIANFLVSSEADERVLLEEYFGRPASEYERARFFLMRQALHMMYAAVFLLLGKASPVGESVETPEFGAFHRQIWAGEINLAEPEERTVYGLVHWKQFRQNVRQARFEEALRWMSERHGGDAAFRPLFPADPGDPRL